MKNLLNKQSVDDLEDEPNPDKTRAGDGWGRHNYTDMNRLERTLHSYTGELWDNVYSKLIKTFPFIKTEPIQKQLEYRIEIHTFITPTGEIHAYLPYTKWNLSPDYPSNETNISSDTWHGFYVHPVSKTVCYKAKKPGIDYAKRFALEEAKTVKRLRPYHQFRKLDGIWYELKTGQHARARNLGYGPNTVLNPVLHPKVWNITPFSLKLSKRQLDHKTLKEHSLSNDVNPGKVTRRKLKKS